MWFQWTRPTTKSSTYISGDSNVNYPQVNDPLDNADYAIVDGADASPKVDEFKRELKMHTLCDMGEIGCMNKFLSDKGGIKEKDKKEVEPSKAAT